ncbi:DNA-binding WRKY [Macleaya cordata]|uniref:DNA-binding WRKY n=1 Tax=Macleaya cordata TaxID=56857 RepID=A0A200R3L5_MACCD|nr:DNA-binding WRKY [Macleaya cordata]
MEETLSVIIHGCKLARDLESNLANLSGSPNVLSNSCNEIIRVFESAIHRLSSLMILINSSSSPPPPPPPPSSSYPPPPPPHHHHDNHQMAVYGDTPPEPRTTATSSSDHHHPKQAGVQEWLKSSYSQAIELLQAQLLVDHHKNPLMMEHHQLGVLETPPPPPLSTTGSGCHDVVNKILLDDDHQYLGVKKNMLADNIINIGDHDGELLAGSTSTVIRMRSSTSGGDNQLQRDEGSDSGKSLPPVQVPIRSRKRKDGVDKLTVKVAGPRIGNMEIPPDDGFTWRKYGQKEILGSTFPRCTHRNFYGCEAKKQVQRLDNDPNTFEVTYYGHHTCHISSSSSTSTSSAAANYMGGSSGTGAGAGAGAGATSSSYVMRDVIMDGTTSTSSVVELVDAIFNSGMSSSSNNSMDSIFPSFHHHHHHPQDNK